MFAQRLALCALLTLGANGGVAMAQQAKPQYSADDIVGSFAKPKADQCVSRGMIAGDDGVCEPAKDARGFSLPTRATSTPAASTSGRSTQARAARQMASISQPVAAPAPHRDLLITFKLGSAELTPQAKANAQVFAQALNNPKLAGMNFEIDGHTDATGAPEKNRVLSQQRAEAVKSFLVAQGVSPARLDAKGYGEDRLAVPSQPYSAENRRVEARRSE
jgi:outer membrane protein OmpA-like peptidoglycan-associated protein